MGSSTADLAQRVQSGIQQVVGALREAAGQELDAREWTQLLGVALTGRNQLDAALTGAVATVAMSPAFSPFGAGLVALSYIGLVALTVSSETPIPDLAAAGYRGRP
jgi:hypothetical protein